MASADQTQKFAEQMLSDPAHAPWWTWFVMAVILLVGAYLVALVVESAKELVRGVARKRATKTKAYHPSQMQLETEFGIYKEAGAQLVTLRNAALALRPELDFVDPKETDEERKRRRLKDLADAYDALYKTVENNRPFYPSDTWTELNALLKLVGQEAIQYRNGDPERDFQRYWETAGTNQRAIAKSIERINETIRTRLDSVSHV